jgi:hypothetical protein
VISSRELLGVRRTDNTRPSARKLHGSLLKI